MSAAAALDTDLENFRAEARQWLEANFPPSLKGANAPIVWNGDWWFKHANNLNKQWLAFTSS